MTPLQQTPIENNVTKGEIDQNAAQAKPGRFFLLPVVILFQESLLYTSIPLRRNVSIRISLRRLIWIDTLRRGHNVGFFLERLFSFLILFTELWIRDIFHALHPYVILYPLSSRQLWKHLPVGKNIENSSQLEFILSSNIRKIWRLLHSPRSVSVLVKVFYKYYYLLYHQTCLLQTWQTCF